VVPLCIFALVCPHAGAMDTGSFGTPVAPGSAGLTSLVAGATALGFVHHRSAQAAENAACAAVDAAFPPPRLRVHAALSTTRHYTTAGCIHTAP
jgi:hypothetical protein